MGKWTYCGVADCNFPCLRLSLSKLSSQSSPPSLFGNRKMPSLSSSGLDGASFAFDWKTITARHKCTLGWPVTFLISRQVKLVSSLHLSGSLDSRGLGQGLVVFLLSLCQTCMIHCHLTRENKAEKWGISGPEGLFLQRSGLHYNVQRGDVTHFLQKRALWGLIPTVLVSNLPGKIV